MNTNYQSSHVICKEQSIFTKNDILSLINDSNICNFSDKYYCDTNIISLAKINKLFNYFENFRIGHFIPYIKGYNDEFRKRIKFSMNDIKSRFKRNTLLFEILSIGNAYY